MALNREEVAKALEALEGEQTQPTETEAVEKGFSKPEGAQSEMKAESGKPMSDEAEASQDEEGKKGKKTKKSEEPVVVKAKKEEAEEEEEEEEDEEEEDGEESEKSLPAFTEGLPEEVEAKIDVSDFLKSLTLHVGDCIDTLSDYVKKSEKSSEGRMETIEKSLEQVAENFKNVGIVLKGIVDAIGLVENSAVRAPKSVITKSDVAERFDSNEIMSGISQDPTIAKGQISGRLLDLAKAGKVRDLDIINFEQTGYLAPETLAQLKN